MIFRAYRLAGATLLALILTACASGQPRPVTPGVVEVGKLRVTIEDGWFRAPGSETPEKRSSTRVLTRDGADTDRLYIIAGVDDGETLFKQASAGGAAPFDASLSSNDLAELVADSLQAALWGGATAVSIGNVSERGFTGIPGVQFELEASGTSNQRGLAGAFVNEERLYAVVFLAESPEVLEQNRDRVQGVIDSAVLTIKTIRR